MHELIDSLLSQLGEYPLPLYASSQETLELFSKKQLPPKPVEIKRVSPPAPTQKAPPPAKIEEPVQTVAKAPAVKAADSGVLELMKKTLPHVQWHTSIPSDAKAKLVKEEWKSPLAKKKVALFGGSESDLSFLESVAAGIEKNLGVRCGVLLGSTVELLSPSLKLVISLESVLFENKKLLPLYRKLPMEGTGFLGDIPLITLSDVSLFKDDPARKRALWNALCQLLK